MISYFIVAIIFIYAIYTLVKFVKKSKQGGACAHCSIKNSCKSNCFSSTLNSLPSQDNKKTI